MRHGFRPRTGKPAPTLAYEYDHKGQLQLVVGHGFHWGNRHQVWKKRRHKYRRMTHLLRNQTPKENFDHVRALLNRVNRTSTRPGSDARPDPAR